MTISTTLPRQSYNTDGVSSFFPVNIQAYQASDFLVLYTLAGVTTQLTLNTNYTMAQATTDTPPKWSLTTITGGGLNSPLAGPGSLQIILNPPETQLSQYVQGQQFPSSAVQTGFDRLTQMVQRLQDLINRCVRVPDGDNLPATLLLAAALRAGMYLATDGNGNIITTAALPGTLNTQGSLGPILWPQTAAETATGAAATAQFYQGLEVIDVLRYGIVPNSAGAATANSAAFKALVNAGNVGPTGRLIFPNTTGADIYYFNDFFQIRDGLRLDLQQCTLNFNKVYAAGDNSRSWLMCIRDVAIENGSITVNYDGSAGGDVNTGPAILIGSRLGYAWPGFPQGIFDQDSLIANGKPPMGNITIRNLRITSNNPAAAAAMMMVMFGGVQNVLIENIVFTGQPGGPTTGFYYEFGNASQNGFPAVQQKWSSSHCERVTIRNIKGINLNTSTSTDAFVVAITEGFNVIVENIHGDNCGGTFQFRIGEAHFFRPWTAQVTGVKRSCTVRNITSQNSVYAAIVLNGSQPTTTGYLSDANMIAAGLPVLTPTQKVDLMHFSIDGFSIDNAMAVDGPIIGRNGTIVGTGAGSGTLWLQAECAYFNFENVEVLNGISVGVRANDLSTVFSRNRIGRLANCKIAGNTGAGVALASVASVKIEQCQIGYNPLYDAVTETTQTDAVSVDCTEGLSGGVDCRGNYTTMSGAGVGYRIIGNPTNPCNISQPKGTFTFSGTWELDGVAQANAITIADKTSYVNNSNGNAAFAVTFTVPPVGTGGNLNANWTGLTGQYLMTFQDGELRPGTFTNGSAAVTWGPALTGAPTAAGNTVNTLPNAKYQGKECNDTSNTRIMVAQGSSPTSNWVRADGGATVTPS